MDTKSKILIVEVEAVTALALEKDLKDLGYEVCEIVDTASSAIQIATDKSPDLIFMGIQLQAPMNGIETARDISARMKIPVVFISEHLDKHTLQAAKLANPYGYIISPFRMEELHATIELARDKATRDKEISENEEWWRAVINASHGAFIAIDREGIVFEWNPRAEELFGYSKSEMLGKLMKDYIIPDSLRAQHEQAFGHYLETGQAKILNHIVEQIGMHKNGSTFPIDLAISVANLRSEQKFFAFIFDISIRKKSKIELDISLEKFRAAQKMLLLRTGELESLNQQLGTLNKEMESFSYSVSHDLRAPLRAMSGFAQALLEDYAPKFDSQGQDFLKRIVSGAKQMGKLIDDLLALSRLSRKEIEIRDVNLSAIAGNLADKLRQFNPARQVEFIIQESVHAQGDFGLLEIVLDNLLSNSWKFTSKHDTARIEFGATNIKGETVYFVSDNGAGFDMQYSEKLFTPFHRFHPENEFTGTGIGLATVQRIIHRHKGRIWAESIVEKKTTFYFTLGHHQQENTPQG